MRIEKKISYHLSLEDVNNVKFKVRFISNRQDQKEIGGFKRIDMYWIECFLKVDGEDFDLRSLCVQPSTLNPEHYYISKNWCLVDTGYNALIKRANDFFRTTKEYQSQVNWTTALTLKFSV